MFVQSAGVKSEGEIDPFTVAVFAEISVALDRDELRSLRSLRRMEKWGDLIGSYDLITVLFRRPSGKRWSTPTRTR